MTTNDQIAADIQTRVRQAEMKQLADGLDQYGDDEVRQAIVHARQDIVLLAHYAKSSDTHLRNQNIKLNLLLLIACAILVAVLL